MIVGMQLPVGIVRIIMNSTMIIVVMIHASHATQTMQMSAPTVIQASTSKPQSSIRFVVSHVHSTLEPAKIAQIQLVVLNALIVAIK